MVEILTKENNINNTELSEFKISPLLYYNNSDIKIIKKIGSGGFSNVYKADFFGTKVAVKSIENNTINEKLFEDFSKEVNILHKIRHPLMITMIGVTVSENKLNIIMEYMKNRSLMDLLKSKKINLKEIQKIKISFQICNYLKKIN